MSRFLASATAALIAGSCGGGGAKSTPTTTGITTVSASDPMAGSSSSSSSGSSSGAGAESTRAAETSTSSAPPDLPGFDTLDLPKGCGKIDLLFVVADSGIIDGGEKQEAIEDAQRVRDATNSFVAVMQEQAADYDLQVMVVKGDPSLTPIDADCCAPEKPCDNLAPYPGCGPYEDDPYCDGVLGVGVTFPMGFMASNVRCDLAGGHRYITDGDADFADAFDCLINVGRSGGVQQYAGAMVRAVGPILNGPDGCNAGFVRPDAMLVVVIIANSLDTKSTGNPEGWAASLVAAKGGNAAGIVVVGLLQTYDPFDADDCWDDPDSAVRRMVEDFPTHVLGSYCAPDLGKYLGDAVSVIDAACAEFVPPG